MAYTTKSAPRLERECAFDISHSFYRFTQARKDVSRSAMRVLTRPDTPSCYSGLDNPMPGRSIITSTPLLALIPLVHPLLLRFRWHFDSERGTNRIDKVRKVAMSLLHFIDHLNNVAGIPTFSRSQPALDARTVLQRRYPGSARLKRVLRRRCYCKCSIQLSDDLLLTLYTRRVILPAFYSHLCQIGSSITYRNYWHFHQSWHIQFINSLTLTLYCELEIIILEEVKNGLD